MQNVKGTADRFGPEELLRVRIRSILEDLFSAYDFTPMDTAILNEMRLLASKYGGGDEILKEMYRVSDQGGRELGLRYDLTLPFAKTIALNPGLSLPFKRYEFGKVFRDGPVKKGRMREFIQCDADIAGIAGPEAEAELMLLAVRVFRQLGLPVLIRWNNRRFLGELLQAAGIPPESQLTVMLTLDKLDKIGLPGVKQELASKELSPEAVAILLQLLQRQNTSFPELCADFRLEDSAGASEVQALQLLLDQLGIDAVCRFDPFLSRGLSFYTGTVFEVFDATEEFRSSLAAGGRYDSMIGRLQGEEASCPAAGISFGLESIAELMGGDTSPARTAGPAVMVIPVGDTVYAALQAAELLRESSIRTRLDYGGRRLKKALAQASSIGCRYALIIGEDEIRDGVVTLKDLEERSEEKLPLEAAVLIIEKNMDMRLFA